MANNKKLVSVFTDFVAFQFSKRDWIPKFSMLLAVLEWGVVDDDMARLARQVAAILTNKKRPAATERSEQIQMEF